MVVQTLESDDNNETIYCDPMDDGNHRLTVVVNTIPILKVMTWLCGERDNMLMEDQLACVQKRDLWKSGRDPILNLNCHRCPGVSIHEICTELRRSRGNSYCRHHRVVEDLKWMGQDGIVLTTVDNEHYWALPYQYEYINEVGARNILVKGVE